MVAVEMPPHIRPGQIPPIRPSSMNSSQSDPRKTPMRSFMDNVVSPFVRCVAPNLDAGCVPGCTSRYGAPPPSVITPHLERPRPAGRRASPPEDVESRFGGGTPSPTHHHRKSPTVPDAGPSSSSSVTAGEAATGDSSGATPQANDVLCGRGGSSNRHPGNVHFRELVAANKCTYVTLTKKQKMLMARKVVETVRSTLPPGRFLAKDSKTGMWYDIGLPRSLEKTSQALREKNSNDATAADGTVVEEEEMGVALSPSKDSSCSSSKKSSRNVEAPPLIVPDHLKETYGVLHNAGPDHEIISETSEGFVVEPGRSILMAPTDSPPHRHRHPHDPYRSLPRRTTNGHYDAYYSDRVGYSSPHHYHTPHHDPYGGGRYSYPPSGDRRDYAYDYRNAAPYGGRPLAPPPPNRMGVPPPHHHYRGGGGGYGPPPSPPVPRRLHYSPSASPPASPAQRYSYPEPHHQHPQQQQHGIFRPGYTKSSNVRTTAEMSPERRQEWKRRRDDQGIARKLSDASLSRDVQTKLTLTSPSGLLQSRARRSIPDREVEAAKALSGLAALSTAAFLKLDEDN